MLTLEYFQVQPVSCHQTSQQTMLKTICALLLIASFVACGTFTQRDINTLEWKVTYIGMTYNAALDQTTFTYNIHIESNGSLTKDLSHWVLGIPLSLKDKIVTSNPSSPTTYSKPDPTTQLTGFKWDGGQNKGTDQIYTITLSGRYSEATVQYAVKGGTYYGIGLITGPGAAIVTTLINVGGSVYLDLNNNAVMDASEPALENVQVQLVSTSTSATYSAVTTSNGNYLFTNVPTGSYALRAVKSGKDYESYVTGYDVPLLLTATQHSLGNNIPLALNLDKLNEDLTNHAVTGDGKTIGFWKHQCTVALTGRGNAQVSAANLLTFLQNAENVALSTLFNFGTNKYQTALNIMAITSSNPVDLLKKQLVAIELNYVSNRGIVSKALQLFVIYQAEYVATNPGTYSSEYILKVKDTCDLINNTGNY